MIIGHLCLYTREETFILPIHDKCAYVIPWGRYGETILGERVISTIDSRKLANRIYTLFRNPQIKYFRAKGCLIPKENIIGWEVMKFGYRKTLKEKK